MRCLATRVAALLAVATPATAAPTAIFSDFRYQGAPLAGAPTTAPPGHYLNPVIGGSNSDPSIVRVGDDYYLATASLTVWPGIPIFHSRDLVHWTQVGAAVSRPDQMRISGLDTWQGLYAPDLKWHAGRFYLTSNCYACGGNFIMTAPRAEGPWSRPSWLPFEGIDPSLFVDDNGRAYIVHNGPPQGKPRWEGHRALWLREIDLVSLTLRGSPTLLVDGGVGEGGKPFWIEGPHLIRRNGRYVLIAAQGGTKENHREVAFAADHIRGPYRPRPLPILTQVGLDPRRPHPIMQAGHADLVRTPAGDWWAVFLASRPFGPGELDYSAGRETFLLPVDWRDGWPVILPRGQVVPTVAPHPKLLPTHGTAWGAAPHSFEERWRDAVLGNRWLTLGTPLSQWWRAGGGELALTAVTATLGGTPQPALLAIRQSAPRATVSVKVRLAGAGEAGLTAYAGRSQHWALLLGNGGREVRVLRRNSASDPEAGTIVARLPLAGDHAAPVRLRIVADGPTLAFAARRDGAWQPVGTVQDGRTLAISRTGNFTGTILGVVALDAQRAAGSSSTATP